MSRIGLIRDLHPAGARHFWMLAATAVVLVFTGWALGAALAIFCAVLAYGHYRMPGVVKHLDGGQIASPLDARVLLAGRALPPGGGDTRFRLRLKGRFTDSRLILAPVSGTVRLAGLRDGIAIETEDGQRVQIAVQRGWLGLRARILTFPGQTIDRGDAVAVAAAGGLTDIFLPAGIRGIAAGHRVLTGQSLT